MLKKYDLTGASSLSTPNFEEKMLYDEKAKKSDFDFRSAVGALQWAATCARPDIAHATNQLARACALPCTTSMAKAARIVMKYLVGTQEYAIEYNPQLEKAFYDEFSKIANEEEENTNWTNDAHKVKEDVHLFTDAAFGVAYKTMKSVSGVAVFLHGCIIAWRSKVQTIMTNCTTQSEWVALSDGIEFASTIYGLDLFLKGIDESTPHQGPIWTDNRGAALIGRKGPQNVEEIPRRSRHVCLKFAHVLEHHRRLFWCPTRAQRSDGLTKSGNPEALRSLLNGPEVHGPQADGDDFHLADELSGLAYPCLNPVKGSIALAVFNIRSFQDNDRDPKCWVEFGRDDRRIV